MSLNEVLERGKRVRLLSGEGGVILAENENFGFPLWEIKLNDGKIITEARYRFDVLIDPHEVPKEPVIPSSPPAVTEELLQLFQSQMYDSDDSDMQTVTVLPDFPPPPTNNEKSLQPVQKDTTMSKYVRQFVPIDEEEVDIFIANQENRGTLKKTTSDLRTLIQFLEKKNEKREIHNIPPKELNNLLSQFFISARKSDGENYEPATLKGQFCSFNRFLKRHDYGHDLTKSIEFCKTRDALTAKQVDLKKNGSGQLGLSNPTALLHTVWFCNTVYFGLRGVTEHYQMRWGDVKLCKDHKNNEYIQMNERNTKTRTGTDVKNKREIPQRAWANLNDQTRCPVEAYKLYKSKRPVNFSKPEDPFYIQENTNPNKSTRWYKSQIVGVNKLGKFMKIMAEKSGTK
ncbi:Hypothetical predicted protein [Mytilus galloprovincialis]|uniref:ZMYM2-like/QRICH1 C-terminal domain-containing protein n=1 Tax=Mytilus galloprovincialis TaxID=29158 RepID=A0A8B6D8C9_MYTGA|nr:Hypothetical predicted protein [Mytilus galloprovincialis]